MLYLINAISVSSKSSSNFLIFEMNENDLYFIFHNTNSSSFWKKGLKRDRDEKEIEMIKNMEKFHNDKIKILNENSWLNILSIFLNTWKILESFGIRSENIRI